MLGACGERAVFEGGYYEGTIEFHGEMGFTDVSANWATGRAPSFPCGWTSETVGGHLPGARLSVSNFGPDQQMFFTVYKNGPHQRADFRANLLEASGDVAIIRSVQVRGPADGFRYGSTSARAIVDPPAPFSGVCDFPQTPPVASDVDR
jgi:hypothetical protein